MILKNWAISAGSSEDSPCNRVVTDPLMAASGKRSSWPITPKNSERSRSASASGVRSCTATTTDSTAPSTERIGVAFTNTTMLRPSGNSTVISSSRTVSPKFSKSSTERPPSKTPRPSARRKVPASIKSWRELIDKPKSPHSRLATWLTDVTAPVAASNTNTLIGAVFTSASRSARARCSPRYRRALEMTSAAWEAKTAKVSSSSAANPPSFSVT